MSSLSHQVAVNNSEFLVFPQAQLFFQGIDHNLIDAHPLFTRLFLQFFIKGILEPSSAVPLGAILQGKVDVAGKKAGIILSGGNLDLGTLPF